MSNVAQKPDANNALTVMDEAAQRERAVVAPVSETAAILSMIERVASDPNVDVGRLERLYDLRERAVAKAEEKAFNIAMAAAQAELPRVVRDAENTHTRSRYARLETISRAITPIITRHGFSMSFGTDDSPRSGHYRVTCRVGHVDGHSREYHADIPADGEGAKGNQNKTATHAFGSTLSYARRYLTLLIFNIAMANEDDDGNGNGNGARQREEPSESEPEHEMVSTEQIAKLRHALDFKGRTEEAFCKAISSVTKRNVSRLADLRANDFEPAIQIIARAPK